MDTIPAYWLVVERTNGSALPPTGAMIQLYSTEDEALAAASALADKYRGKTYSIAKITAQVTVRPTAVVEQTSPAIDRLAELGSQIEKTWPDKRK